uniref:Avirulence protein AvrP4 n=1 Tax=Melampsora lini TaxID=5261 RepID=B2ZCR8_MELLI|nr:avirulence protein AvrP4 [Melampsora lini]
MLIMMGTQLREIVLLSLILSISIVPMMCEFLEDVRDIQGFSRKSGSKLEEESDRSRNKHEEADCESITCALNAACGSTCGDCDFLLGTCLKKP